MPDEATANLSAKRARRTKLVDVKQHVAASELEPIVVTAMAEPPPPGALPAAEIERLTADIITSLKTVYDPEIPSDIYELGLIYKVDIDDDRNVKIEMTLTAPGCPVAGEMPIWVQNAVSMVPGVNAVEVEIVFDPPWDQSRMSEEARLALNMF